MGLKPQRSRLRLVQIAVRISVFLSTLTYNRLMFKVVAIALAALAAVDLLMNDGTYIHAIAQMLSSVMRH